MRHFEEEVAVATAELELMEAMQKEGGAAFPLDTANMTFYGMSTRDWFAGQIVAGGLARDTMKEYELQAIFGPHRTGITRAEILAADAYQIADAMLKARVRKGVQP